MNWKAAAILILSIFAVTVANCEDLPESPIITTTPSRPVTQPFLANRLNRSLVAGEFTVRLLDAISTRQALSDPCKCLVEKSLPQFIAKSTPLMLSYSLGTAAAYTFVADKLWKHHKRLSRGLLMFDISYDSAVGPKNNWHNIAKSR